MEAVTLALLLGAASGWLTPVLLRWCPTPDGAGAPFAALATIRFRWLVAATAVAAGLVVFTTVPVPYWAAWAPLVGLGALLAWVDAATGYLPLRLTWLGTGASMAGAGVAAVWQQTWSPLLTAAGSGLLAAGFFWLLWRASGGQLGFGDVRLAGFIGAAVGAAGLVPAWQALLLGALAGAGWGLVVRWRRGADGAFPYGPALLLGPLG